MIAIMDPESAKRLSRVFLETQVDASRRALIGEVEASMYERTRLKGSASMERVKDKDHVRLRRR